MTPLIPDLFPFKEHPARHHTPASLKSDTYARHPVLGPNEPANLTRRIRAGELRETSNRMTMTTINTDDTNGREVKTMADILKWNQYGEDLLSSSGGPHAYTATRASDEPHYPWILLRSDGRGARVTNAERCKDIAELCERDPRNAPVLLDVMRKRK